MRSIYGCGGSNTAPDLCVRKPLFLFLFVWEIFKPDLKIKKVACFVMTTPRFLSANRSETLQRHALGVSFQYRMCWNSMISISPKQLKPWCNYKYKHSMTIPLNQIQHQL